MSSIADQIAPTTIKIKATSSQANVIHAAIFAGTFVTSADEFHVKSMIKNIAPAAISVADFLILVKNPEYFSRTKASNRPIRIPN